MLSRTYWTKTYGEPWIAQGRREKWNYGPRISVIRYDDTLLVPPGEGRQTWILCRDGVPTGAVFDDVAEAMRAGETIG
jgi:hypothetical protein